MTAYRAAVAVLVAAPDVGPAEPVCADFRPSAGGAHPWCDRCGWRRDYHPGRADAGTVAP